MSLSFDSIQVGQALPEIKKDPITQVQLIKYAGASGDFNPIHTIPQYAREAGLDGTIAHGMLIMGILGQMVSSWAGILPVAKYNVSFKGMTKLGDELIASGEVTKKDEEGKTVEAKIQVADTNGELKVDGKLSLKF